MDGVASGRGSCLRWGGNPWGGSSASFFGWAHIREEEGGEAEQREEGADLVDGADAVVVGEEAEDGGA